MTMIALVSETPRVPFEALTKIASAVSSQLAFDVGPAWGRLPWCVGAAADRASAGGDIVLVLVEADPSVPNALGRHTEGPDGTVYGEIVVSPVLDNGGTLTDGPNSVSSVVSHEVIETFLDAAVSTWDQAADGKLYAHEGCDAVEGDAYQVQGVSVSNFVCPAFFDSSAKTGSRFDFLGKLVEPFTMTPGGYQVVMSGDLTVTQTFGDKMPAWKRVAKAARGRGAQRLAVRP
jgi:hypothetical protein